MIRNGSSDLIGAYNQYVAALAQFYATDRGGADPTPNLQVIYNTLAALAPYFHLPDDTSYTVHYQVRGSTYNIQVYVDGQELAYGDLDASALAAAIEDPITVIHGGDPSWYLGVQLSNVIHLVDLQPGIEWHIDAFNPMSGALGLLLHTVVDFVPFILNPSGASGTVTCSLGSALCSTYQPNRIHYRRMLD
jgi:hypothetical protein